MPLWVHPSLRARQEAEENAHIIQKRDSVSVTIAKALESAGVKAKPLPKITIYIGNISYVPI